MLEMVPTSAQEWKCLGDEFLAIKKYKNACICYMMCIHLDETMLNLCAFNDLFRHTEVGLVFTQEEVDDWTKENLPIDFTKIGNHQVLSKHNSAQLTIDKKIPLFTVVAGNFVALPNFFRWIVPGHLCASGRPETAEQISALQVLGVSVVVSLPEEAPLPPVWFSSIIANNFIPVTDYTVPSSKQVRAFIDLVESGKCVHIHCRAGIGRTGTFLACHLALHGFHWQSPSPVMTGDQAIKALRTMRPDSVETQPQELFVQQFVKASQIQPEDLLGFP